MGGIQGISINSFVMNTQNADNRKGQERFLNDAATVLGISAEELEAQLQSGKDLQTIVSEQGLTMEEFRQGMDELRPGGQNAPPPPPPGKGSEQFLADAATVLGISTDELKSRLQSGKDLQTIVTEQGLTMEEFQQQMITLFNSNQSAGVDQTGNILNRSV
ncbi:MAG: hypothetical protein K6T65_15185 [Peptococcaceae bacterium]|nr:hypothetical protein [Peptococcaceae bacterium]